MTWLIFWSWGLLSYIVGGDKYKKALCLLDDKLADKNTFECNLPLERGPCSEGEVVVLGDSVDGVCNPELSCKFPEVPVLDSVHGQVCQCVEGMAKVSGLCHHLFSSLPCPEGQVLLRKNFVLGQKDKMCPVGFSCKAHSQCSAFKQGIESALKTESVMVQKLVIRHFRSNRCNLKNMKICCPDEDDGVAFSPFLIYKNLKNTVEAERQANPYPGDKWPWQDSSNGETNCVEASKDVLDKCIIGFELNHKRILVCTDNMNMKFSITGKQETCRRGRRWYSQSQRCVRIF